MFDKKTETKIVTDTAANTAANTEENTHIANWYQVDSSISVIDEIDIYTLSGVAPGTTVYIYMAGGFNAGRRLVRGHFTLDIPRMSRFKAV